MHVRPPIQQHLAGNHQQQQKRKRKKKKEKEEQQGGGRLPRALFERKLL
jgi:hypothetical protein